MTRDEHLKWAKERALEYAKRGDAANAIGSMVSDLSKHPELGDHAGLKLGMMMLMGGHLQGQEAVRFIEGFN